MIRFLKYCEVMSMQTVRNTFIWQLCKEIQIAIFNRNIGSKPNIVETENIFKSCLIFWLNFMVSLTRTPSAERQIKFSRSPRHFKNFQVFRRLRSHCYHAE